MLSGRRLLVYAFAALAAIHLVGCDVEVDPFVEEDRFFTIFGFLDTAAEQQLVRVEALRTEFAARGDEPIDAEVRTTAIESGEVVVWRDSVVAFADGSFGHVFVGDFRPNPGWTYRFEVERSDGALSSAVTTIPLPTNVSIREPVITNEGAFQTVRWSQIERRPFRVEVWYRLMNTQPTQPFLSGIVTYGDGNQRFGQFVPDTGEWEILVRLSEDREDVLNQLSFSPDAQPFLLSLGIRLTMSDDGWEPPGGVFDREVLVQPGTFSNIKNGFGFLGAVNQYTTEWTVPATVIERMGYSVPQ